MKAFRVALLLAVALFCLYGFIAAGEPGESNFYFRIGYPIVGLACIAIAAASVMPARKTQDR
jgi:hypothetical protein